VEGGKVNVNVYGYVYVYEKFNTQGVGVNENLTVNEESSAWALGWKS
jgi:hypothetical protein